MEHIHWHQLGMRDAMAETFMHIRMKGERPALRELAQDLLNFDTKNPNPHAKWYLENHKAGENEHLGP